MSAERVLARLRREFEERDDESAFDALEVFLMEQGPPHAAVAGQLGISEGAVKVRVHRLRRRFGKLLRDEISQTVARAEDVDSELRHLLEVL